MSSATTVQQKDSHFITNSLTRLCDRPPAERAALQKKTEQRRAQDRRALELARREATKRADMHVDGHNMYIKMWSEAEKSFRASEESTTLISRCTSLLSDRIERRDQPHVLVTSDHPLRLAFYAELLRMVGCRVETTRLLSEAVRVAAPLVHRTPSSAFDVIIVDRPRSAENDQEAAQMLMDMSYSIRIRDAVYRKEHLSAVSNKFVFVLGETDLMAPFVMQSNGDALCVRRPFYFHLKRIRQLLLPAFVNTQLRLRIYRKEPNFDRISRLLGGEVAKLVPASEKAKKRRRKHRVPIPGEDDDPSRQEGNGEESEAHDGNESGDSDSEASNGDDAHGGEGSSSVTGGGKEFVTYESLAEENEHLHNVIIAHIRNKARLEEKMNQMEAQFREREERYRFTMQGLEGHLRDKDAEIGELTDIAKQLRSKLHDMQVRELQLTQQLHAAQTRRPIKKKESVASLGTDAPLTGEGVTFSVPQSAAENTSLTQNKAATAALSSQLDALLHKQLEDSRKRKAMIQSVSVNVSSESEVVRTARLHAVEINSKPVQCDIWAQSPQEQAEIMKALVAQQAVAAKKAKAASMAAKKAAKAANVKDPLLTGRSSSPDSSAAPSRAMSRQMSRGSMASRSSMSSADEDFFMNQSTADGSLAEMSFIPVKFDTFLPTDNGGMEDAMNNLRVENNALRRQVQFFKMQQSLAAQAPSNAAQPTSLKVLPTADALVADGVKDTAFLHKKIATLSHQVMTLEAALAATAASPSTESSPTSRHASLALPMGTDEGGVANHAVHQDLLEDDGAPPQTIAPPPVPAPAPVKSHTKGGNNRAAAQNHAEAAVSASTSDEVMHLREAISRLEYKVHSLDLLRITSHMQKLVYKGAMMRLLQTGSSPQQSPRGGGGGTSTIPRKKWTKDTAVNTTIDMTAAEAWVAATSSAGGALFSVKEMEQRISELGQKLKESNQCFKESRDQHLQSERRVLEMRMELERMQATHLETTDALKGVKRLLAVNEDSVKAFKEKNSNLEKQNTLYKQTLEARDTLIAQLQVRPVTVQVGSQTKITGDVAKKAGSSFVANKGGPATDGSGNSVAADAPGSIRSLMKAHGQEIPVTPRGDDDAEDIEQSIVIPASVAASPNGRRVMSPQSFSLTLNSQAQDVGAMRLDLNTAGTNDTSFDGTLTTNPLLNSALINAPTEDEIQYLVTTRMAALALYSAAHVDGCDVPRPEHDAIVNRLKKECGEYVNTIRKLNDLRNAQRVEITELRALYREMKDNRSTVPQLQAALEDLNKELTEEKLNAMKRERLLRKEFDLLRLKYAHDDDLLAMAAYDIDAFAVHTLRAPLDFNNDRSAKFVCIGVEHVLGASRRLLANISGSSLSKAEFNDQQTQTSVFVDHILAGPGEELASSDKVATAQTERRGKRRVQILEQPIDAVAIGSEDASPVSSSLTSPLDKGGSKSKNITAGAANRSRRTAVTFGTVLGSDTAADGILKPHNSATVQPQPITAVQPSSLITNMAGPGSAPASPTIAAGVPTAFLPIIKVAQDAEMQTIELERWVTHTETECTLLTEASVIAALPANVRRNIARHSTTTDAPHAAPQRSTRRSTIQPPAAAVVNTNLTAEPTSPQSPKSPHRQHGPPSPAARSTSTPVQFGSLTLDPSALSGNFAAPAPPSITGTTDAATELVISTAVAAGVPDSAAIMELDPVSSPTHRTVATPLQRGSLLQTPASRHSSQRMRRRSFQNEMGVIGGPSRGSGDGEVRSVSSGSGFLPDDYESLAFVETKSADAQTEWTGDWMRQDIPETVSLRLDDVSVMLDWLCQLDAIDHLVEGAALEASADGRNDPLGVVSQTTRSSSSEQGRPGPLLSRREALVDAARSAIMMLLDIPSRAMDGASVGSQNLAPLEPPFEITVDGSNPAASSSAANMSRNNVVGRARALSQRLSINLSALPEGHPLSQLASARSNPAIDISANGPLSSRSNAGSDALILTSRRHSSARPKCSTKSSQTDPDGSHPDFRRSSGFSLYHGEFSPQATVVRNVKDCGCQSDDLSSWGSEIRHHQARDSHDDNAPIIQQPKSADIECQGTQTDPDANPSKLMSAMISMHNTFLKLVGKLRSSLSLPAQTTHDTSWMAAPSIKAAHDAAVRDCTMMELIMEKLSVAYRGLRNTGLHGADLSVAMLHVLVDRGGGVAGDSAALDTALRHFSESPLSQAASRADRPLLPSMGVMVGPNPSSRRLPPLAHASEASSFAAERGAEVTLAISSPMGGAEQLVLVPPVRGVEEVLAPLSFPADRVLPSTPPPLVSAASKFQAVTRTPPPTLPDASHALLGVGKPKTVAGLRTERKGQLLR